MESKPAIVMTDEHRAFEAENLKKHAIWRNAETKQFLKWKEKKNKKTESVTTETLSA